MPTMPNGRVTPHRQDFDDNHVSFLPNDPRWFNALARTDATVITVLLYFDAHEGALKNELVSTLVVIPARLESQVEIVLGRFLERSF